MNRARVFGKPEPNVQCTERRSAYVVVLTPAGSVAMVKGREKFFLPGGGAMPDEGPEQTVAREVDEELARNVYLTRKLGEATQYFYADSDTRHYKMIATFFAGEFGDDHDRTGEHTLHWVPVAAVERYCFHSCHAWAIRHASAATSIAG